MKILFLMRHSGYLRNYESLVKLLADRGHKIHLIFMKYNEMFNADRVADCLSGYPNITYVEHHYKKQFSSELVKFIRQLQDYLRFQDKRYHDAIKLRKRAETYLPRFIVSLARGLVGDSEKRMWFAIRVLRSLDKLFNPSKEIIHIISFFNPDLFLITPLVDFGATQLDWLKAAKQLRIRNGLCVASWDNLTNKGLIQIEPDAIFVWNEIQKREVTELHKVTRSKIIVTGAQCYDKWFNCKPSIPREEFHRKVGLLPTAPLLLYICSSPFIAPFEVDFVRKWIKQIREQGSDLLKEAGILIRPHPQNAKQWLDVDFSEFDNVTIYPREGANPIEKNTQEDFYNSIYFSSAVIGINTSSMIESGILDKPVFTITTEDFSATQVGTLHFRYMVEGGLLYIGKTFKEHIQQLDTILNSQDMIYKDRIRKFICSFIRPQGLGIESTSVFVDEVEKAEVIKPVSYQKNKILIFVSKILMLPGAIFMIVAVSIYNRFHRLNQRRIAKQRAKKKAKEKQAKSALYKNRIYFPYLVLWVFLKFSWRIIRVVKLDTAMKASFIPALIEKLQVILNKINDTKSRLNEISKSQYPIIIGPWLSEVGFEVLYWIPFLNWVIKEYHLDKNRITVISRGGAQLWYQNISVKYLDVFDYFSQNEFKNKNNERMLTGTQKHTSISGFDNEIINFVKKDVGSENLCLLHPSIMYNLFKSYWRKVSSIDLVDDWTIYTKFKPIENNDAIPGLPKDYIAMKFYFSPPFPATEENKEFVFNLISKLSVKYNIVLLNTGLDLDDHKDSYSGNQNKIFTLEHMMTPRNNLEIQTKAISGAKLFIGTYGGFSYLPPFYGVPSIAIYSHEDKFLPVHLDVSYRAFREIKFGSFDKAKNTPGALSDKADKYQTDFIAMNTHNFDILMNLFNGENLYEINLQRTKQL